MAPQIDQVAPKCFQKLLLGKTLFQMILVKRLRHQFYRLLMKCKTSMPLWDVCLDLWGPPQSPVSVIWGTILASFPEPSSANLNAKYLLRELAKNFQKAVNNERSPQNSTRHFAIYKENVSAISRTLQNYGAAVCAPHSAWGYTKVGWLITNIYGIKYRIIYNIS